MNDSNRIRPRRLRRSQALRDMVSETRVHADQLIMPHFVLGEDGQQESIESMPGIDRMGPDRLLRQVEADRELGIRSVLLFGLTGDSTKDSHGTASKDPTGAGPRAIALLKKEFGDDLLVITDVCLCPFTDHGHCGPLENGQPDNDATLPLLGEMARVHADAGADFVAPSDMMDHRVAAIRDALDQSGHAGVGILSYSVKFASAYYGPFRDAASSSPQEGNRAGYQMDLRNGREAEREALLDEAEGADMLMVKPALAYLDVIRRVREVSRLPLAAYNVSGEYSAVKAAAERGWLEESLVVRENLTAMARAGADLLITYHARDALREGWL